MTGRHRRRILLLALGGVGLLFGLDQTGEAPKGAAAQGGALEKESAETQHVEAEALHHVLRALSDNADPPPLDLSRVHRDPFAPLAAVPAAQGAAAGEPAPASEIESKASSPAPTPGWDVVWQQQHALEAVVTGQRPAVIVNGFVVRLGERLDGCVLEAVSESSATFRRNGVRIELELR